MASSKLLKEAIADAKAVRETALANAKLQLEEAFTPRLKNILQHKLRAEAEDLEADDEMHEEEEEKVEEELSSSNIGGGAQPTLDSAADEDELGAADVTKTSGKPEDEVEDYDFAKSITEEEDEDSAEDAAEDAAEYNEEEEMEDDSMEAPSEDDLDLEAIIRELEDELGAAGEEEMEEGEYGAEEMEEGEYEDENPNAEKIAELRKQIAELEGGEDEEASEMEEGEEEDGEELNIESIIKELEDEEAAEEEEKKAVAESKTLKNELAQAISVIRTLKSTINEINLLNAKLLYSNKLFRGYNLTNEQKTKVIDSFDRTGTIREVKLVYSTIAESMKMGGSVKKVQSAKRMTEGASKPQKSTGVKKQIISENSAYSDRFKKLAGLIK
jgi:hypothetical protein